MQSSTDTGARCVRSAASRPGFLGREAGVSAVHVKHLIGCFLLGIGCVIFAWFRSGPKTRRA